MFEAGDMVLVLLLSESNKLRAKWQGPYLVLDKLSNTTYKICMDNKRKKVRIFHVNMLAGWTSPTVVCMVATSKEDGGDISVPPTEDVPTWWEPEMDETTAVDPELSEDQKSQLTTLLSDFASLFKDTPGHTTKASIMIDTNDATPVHLPPYRLPKARHGAVQEEIRQMLEAGLIEPSYSPWASPIVLVPKRMARYDCASITGS